MYIYINIRFALCMFIHIHLFKMESMESVEPMEPMGQGWRSDHHSVIFKIFSLYTRIYSCFKLPVMDKANSLILISLE